MICACALTAATLLRATQGSVELAREAVRAETLDNDTTLPRAEKQQLHAGDVQAACVRLLLISYQDYRMLF